MYISFLYIIVLLRCSCYLSSFTEDVRQVGGVVGVVGRVSCPVRAGGTGEIVYEQLGATRSAIARSEDGESLEKETEVYVIRYEKGIAYVKRWEDLPLASLGTSKQETRV